MFRRPVMNATGRRAAALLAAVALAASGLLVPAPSGAAPFRVESLAQQEPPDLWTGDWLLEGQIDADGDEVPDDGGAFFEFGVITLQKVTGAAAEAAISEEEATGGSFFTGLCLREISDGAEGHVYRGSYEFGTGGRLWGCADDSLEGLEVYIHYHGSDDGHGEILVKWKDGDPPTFFGDYGPPHFDPQLHRAEYLEARGTKVESQKCEAPDSAASTPRAPVGSGSSHSPTTTARLAETATELARPFPIEGVWKRRCGGAVEVRPGAQEGTFVGTAFGPGPSVGFKGCDLDYQPGDEIWDIRVEASAPTQYSGTFDCEGDRQATWEVFLDARDFSKDKLIFCFVDATENYGCDDLLRRKRATRTFDMTLNMNAIGKQASGKNEGKATPQYLLYRTTTAELNNGRFEGRWDGGQDSFEDLFEARGKLIIEDLFSVGRRDERTELKVNSVETPSLVFPGKAAAGRGPEAFLHFEVTVQSSDWKGCADATEGVVTLGWNLQGSQGRADTFRLKVCGRDRLYEHHDPDDQSRVDVEVTERPPK